jgi:hypothetical protein
LENPGKNREKRIEGVHERIKMYVRESWSIIMMSPDRQTEKTG